MNFASIEEVKVPISLPKTELQGKLSAEMWPITMLKPESETEFPPELVDRLAKIEEDEFVLFKEKEIFSCKPAKGPLHMIFNGIEAFSEALREGKYSAEQYLLSNLTLLVKEEPSVMCAMALIHSRITNICFVNSNEEGGICSKVCLSDLSNLNYSFKSFKLS